MVDVHVSMDDAEEQAWVACVISESCDNGIYGEFHLIKIDNRWTIVSGSLYEGYFLSTLLLLSYEDREAYWDAVSEDVSSGSLDPDYRGQKSILDAAIRKEGFEKIDHIPADLDAVICKIIDTYDGSWESSPWEPIGQLQSSPQFLQKIRAKLQRTRQNSGG